MKNENTPSYLKWVFTDHYFKNGRGIGKFIGMLYGIFQVFYVPPMVLEEYYGGWIPLFPVILMYLTIWGFLIGITLQPYGIYRKLVRMNWFEKNKNNLGK